MVYTCNASHSNIVPTPGVRTLVSYLYHIHEVIWNFASPTTTTTQFIPNICNTSLMTIPIFQGSPINNNLPGMHMLETVSTLCTSMGSSMYLQSVPQEEYFVYRRVGPLLQKNCNIILGTGFSFVTFLIYFILSFLLARY